MAKSIGAEVEISVPFHDVDSMGIVWHGHYIKYFELARCALLESFNFGYVEMAKSDYSWPVVETRVKYVQPIRYRQDVLVQATLKEWEYRLKIDYLIRDKATGLKLTRGYTVQAAVDISNNELCLPLPSILAHRLRPFVDADV